MNHPFFISWSLVAIFAAIGVPLAGLAMATLAAKLLSGMQDPLAEVNEMLSTPVTQKEIDMMIEFGLEDGNEEVDKAEYVILCMVRMGAADPGVVSMMTERFIQLDTSGDDGLSYNELMGLPEDTPPGGARKEREISDDGVAMNPIMPGQIGKECDSSPKNTA